MFLQLGFDTISIRGPVLSKLPSTVDALNEYVIFECVRAPVMGTPIVERQIKYDYIHPYL